MKTVGEKALPWQVVTSTWTDWPSGPAGTCTVRSVPSEFELTWVAGVPPKVTWTGVPSAFSRLSPCTWMKLPASASAGAMPVTVGGFW